MEMHGPYVNEETKTEMAMVPTVRWESWPCAETVQPGAKQFISFRRWKTLSHEDILVKMNE